MKLKRVTNAWMKTAALVPLRDMMRQKDALLAIIDMSWMGTEDQRVLLSNSAPDSVLGYFVQKFRNSLCHLAIVYGMVSQSSSSRNTASQLYYLSKSVGKQASALLIKSSTQYWQLF